MLVYAKRVSVVAYKYLVVFLVQRITIYVIRYAIIVMVDVACISHPVTIAVQLVCIGNGPAVVVDVWHAVVVIVCIANIQLSVAVCISLGGGGDLEA